MGIQGRSRPPGFLDHLGGFLLLLSFFAFLAVGWYRVVEMFVELNRGK